MDPANEVIDDFLTHFGTKGMRWGVRSAIDRAIGTKTAGRRPGSSAAEKAAKAKSDKIKSAEKAIKKAEKIKKREKRVADFEAAEKARLQTKFTQTVKSEEFKARVHNETVNVMNNYRVPQINRKYAPYLVDGTLKDPNHPVTKKYWDDVTKAYVEEANKHISTITDVTGTKRLVAVQRKPDEWAKFRGEDPSKEFAFDIQVEDIKHADDILYTVAVTLDSKGLAVDFKIVPNTLTQGTLFVEDILAHTGVKGMRWGVRRRATVGPTEVIISDKRKKLKTSGGKGHPAHAEAISARTSGQIAKKSGYKALSNQQLQAYNQRLNLEQQAQRLTFQDQNAGKRFIMTLMGKSAKGGIEQGGKAALKSGYVKKRIVKGAALVATVL